jgi:hypothetical protein
MGSGFGPTPPPRWHRYGMWLGITLGCLLALLIGIGVAADNAKPTIDPATCEFVLTPERDKAFLQCPVPEGVDIPNWPDKVAPLNKE